MKIPSDKKDLQKMLAKEGYYAQRPEVAAGMWLCDNRIISGTKSLLLQGVPGVGKTFFCESFANALEIPYFYYLCHAWSDDQDMYKGVDVTEAVAGNHEKVALPGLLTKASETSKKSKVLILIDEIDKTEDRTQNLFLDWLQTGRVQWSPTEQIQGNVKNLMVCITSNATKPISPALMRRLRRLTMVPLPQDLQIEVISKKTGVPQEKVKSLIEVAYKVAELDRRDISLQELTNLVVEVLNHNECIHDIQETFSSWCLRSIRNRSQADDLVSPLESILVQA